MPFLSFLGYARRILVVVVAVVVVVFVLELRLDIQNGYHVAHSFFSCSFCVFHVPCGNAPCI